MPCASTTRYSAVLIATFVIASTTLVAASDQPEKSLSIPELVGRMVAAQAQSRLHGHAYTVQRLYQVVRNENEEDSKRNKSEITAEITFLPPAEKKFAIQKSSGGVAERVVRKTLEHEVGMTRNPTINGINPENYDFELLGKESISGRDCYLLKLLPKRESKDLLEGRIWVDGQRFLIRRVEGAPARNPSWWVKDVQLAIDYGDVGGIWLQTASRARAHVRFAGDYSMFSQQVSFRRAEVVADAGNRENLRKTKVQRPLEAGVGSGIVLHRRR
jgi:hypothetical protein